MRPVIQPLRAPEGADALHVKLDGRAYPSRAETSWGGDVDVDRCSSDHTANLVDKDRFQGRFVRKVRDSAAGMARTLLGGWSGPCQGVKASFDHIPQDHRIVEL
jgi:hypothetical protein